MVPNCTVTVSICSVLKIALPSSQILEHTAELWPVNQCLLVHFELQCLALHMLILGEWLSASTVLCTLEPPMGLNICILVQD